MNEQHKTEDGDLKTGFDRVYRREIEPHLDKLEHKRRRRVRSFYLRIAVVGLFVAAGAAAVTSFELYRDYTFVVPVLFAAAVLIGYFVISAPARQQREEVKDLVIGPICDFLGELAYERKPSSHQPDPDRFEDLGVVPQHSRTKLEDRFTGRYRDTGFQMIEARLRTGGKNKRTVFRGLLFEIEVPKPFSGRVLMIGDQGILGNTITEFLKEKFGGLERLEFGGAFEERYQVFTDTPEAARRLLSPGFQGTMVALAEAADRKALNAAMAEGRFLLALPHSKDLFEIGKLHRSLEHFREDVDTLMFQITIPHRVIDFLHGDRPSLLA
jgi:hypothetical protein